MKQKFSPDLQDVLDRIPQSDILIMLGDYNARAFRECSRTTALRTGRSFVADKGSRGGSAGSKREVDSASGK